MLAFPSRTRLQQVLLSINTYYSELDELSGLRDWYHWAYYKTPNLFPLMRFPPRVGIEVTNACNFSCPHCWRSVMDRKVGMMELDIFEKIVSELAQHRPCMLKIFGLGEPALHSRFRDFMEIVSHHRVPLALYTNGTLFRRFRPSEILQWKLPLLVVSVDGTDAQSYNLVRIGGNFDTLNDSVRKFFAERNRLGRHFPVLEIRHVILPHETNSELLRFKTTWLETADRIKFNFLVTPTYQGMTSGEPTLKCRDIRRELYVEWDGRVPVCGGAYHGEYIGDLHHSTIEELWRHPRKEELRSCHQNNDLRQVPLCTNCGELK